ncbi:MAG: hypothetical protein AUH84_00470 [Thaumarchaeota archaeon 13_1_40CM_4_38_7]|nr:MAG: hypothetical protein AUH84_00470 [Thaumarchaeota archaeon 13_1_40CM_4_38_7]OLC93037.1 MAG: hypothetical protein AUI92_03830 [Thaumarchaeota archaeon 13_1_40CM_3_38_6]
MKKSIKNLTGLVIGCGSIGERHLRNLKKIGVRKILVYDKDHRVLDKLSEEYNAKIFYDLNSALTYEPNFSIICTHPNSHVMLANACVNANSHVFVEKPLSSNLSGVVSMLKRARSKNLQVAVGYNLRFDQSLQFVKNKLMKSGIGSPASITSQWGNNIKFWKSYKKNHHYVLRKGGGIILEDSHEYDYVRWLLDDEVKSVYCQTIKSTAIKTETESLASIILKFKRGTIANLILDYMRPEWERNCHIIAEKGDIRCEYRKEKGLSEYPSIPISATLEMKFTRRKPRPKKFPIRFDMNDSYIKELQHFLQCVIRNKKPIVDGWEGLKTLKIGLAALESAKKGKIIKF